MNPESRLLEYKRQANDFKNIARTVVAFANGDGGTIIIGVDDKSRQVAGLPMTEADRLMERLPVSLADTIQPPFFPQIYERTIDDKAVLVVQVFPGQQKPYFISSEGIEKGVYLRIGAHTRRAEGEILEELRLLRSRCAYDEQPMPACPVTELHTGSLPKLLQSEKALLSLEIVRHDPFSGTLLPTRAGILLFHPHPERFIPEAVIIVSKMRGETGRDTIETHEITGPLPSQIESAMAVLEGWLGRNPKVKQARYVNTATILPLVVIREALCNAVFHRQYSIAGAVKIALYADRLEVFSPGHFAGPFVAESLGDGTSYIRNKALGMTARRLQLMEKRGTGIRLIMEKMKAIGSQSSFIEGANWFKVVLPFPLPESAHASTSQQIVLAMFQKATSITSAMVCKSLGVSKATAVGVLESLIRDEKIKRTGNGPATRYVVTGF